MTFVGVRRELRVDDDIDVLRLPLILGGCRHLRSATEVLEHVLWFCRPRALAQELQCGTQASDFPATTALRAAPRRRDELQLWIRSRAGHGVPRLVDSSVIRTIRALRLCLGRALARCCRHRVQRLICSSNWAKFRAATLRRMADPPSCAVCTITGANLERTHIDGECCCASAR